MRLRLAFVKRICDNFCKAFGQSVVVPTSYERTKPGALAVMSIHRRASGTSDDWLVLLESSYHHLCRSVRPEAFFSWLRCKGVFTLNDQEEVEHKYITTVMKAGHLIDIVKAKGYQGFLAFMEVVEYIYPETFSILTGRQPRKPPLEFEPKASIGSSVLREKRSHALSAEILGQMGDLVNVLSKANACKKEELDKLQAYVKKLQEENKTMCDENHSLLLKFKDAQEEIDQLKQKLTVLLSKHENDTAKQTALLSECDRLCVLKDKYMVENQKLREERDDLGHRMLQLNDREMLRRSQTCRNPSSSSISQMREEGKWPAKNKEKNMIGNPSTEVRSKKQEVNLERNDSDGRSCFESKDNSTNDERIHELEIIKDDLEMRAKEWENRHAMLQDRYTCLLVNLEELTAERNQVHHQMDDLQSMYGKEREENQRLATDCDKYREKFCIMEGQMTFLKQEIDELRAMTGADSPFVDNLSDVQNRLLLKSSTENKSNLSKKDATNGTLLSSVSVDCQGKKSSRPVQIIHQTPGLCPDLKRQVVVTVKSTKQQSTSST